MAKLDDYKDLKKTYDYNKEKATRLAEAMTEAVEVEARLRYLKKLANDNIDLNPFLWKTVDGKVIALHDLEDDHLRNIVGHLVRHGRPINDQLRAEAESRGIDTGLIEQTTPQLRAYVDAEEPGGDWDDWRDD
jgi:hypothetical protein